MAPIKLRIDVGAMALNVAAIRRQCPGALVMAVVKAGAYGADAPELARHLAAGGVDQFAVSHADEGVALRRAGVTAPVLVLLATPDELAKARRARLTVTVHSPELLARRARRSLRRSSTCTSRSTPGCGAPASPPTTSSARSPRSTPPAWPSRGLMSHLSSADDPALDHLTRQQLATFDAVVDSVRTAGLAGPDPPRPRQRRRLPLPRPGDGHGPRRARPARHRPVELVRHRPRARAVADADEPAHRPPRLVAGDHVGYGATFEAERPLVTGVVQLGYHDGIFRTFQHGGAVVIDGHRCPVVGRVSMDSLVVDLTACPDVAVGAEVVVFGAHGDSAQPIEDVAAAMGTIPYEVIARLGPRVQRVFVRH